MMAHEPVNYERLTQFFRDSLQSAVDDGLEPPYYLAAIAVNGETVVLQDDYQEEADNFRAMTLCEAHPDGYMILPINAMLPYLLSQHHPDQVQPVPGAHAHRGYWDGGGGGFEVVEEQDEAS
jgi:hypothetical protein